MKKLKQKVKDFFNVTPKEWVAVQLACASVVTAITAMWDTLTQVLGPEDSTDVRTGLKIILGLAAFIAAYAQTKAKKV